MKKIVFMIGLAFIIALLYIFPPRFVQQPIRSVTVTGEAQTQKTNEVAMFSAGVNAVNDDKQKAVDEVNLKVTELIEAVKKFGVGPKDIKTQNLNIYQNQESYYEDGRQKQRLGQWSVSNTIEVTLRDVKRTNELTGLFSQSGANNVYGPNFSLEKNTSDDAALTALAVADARKKAEDLAKTGKAKLGKIITITEGYANNTDPYLYNKGFSGGGGGANMATEVGSTTVSKAVTVIFELR